MKQFFQILKYHKQPHILSLMFLGFVSGLPFLLVVSSLPIWLTPIGYSKTIIGWMFLTTIPYSTKFLWAPLIDQYQLPYLCDYFGQRRGWALCIQVFLFISIIGLGLSDPQNHIVLTVFFAFLVSFCAASQDIVLDAYRIERLKTHELGIGTSMSGIGFRLGMLVSGAGSLYLQSLFSWSFAYIAMAFIGLIGIITTLLVDEVQSQEISSEVEQHYKIKSKDFIAYLQGVLNSFMAIGRHAGWPLLILLIFFYKIGDSIPNAMSGPLFVDLEFSAIEIANASKTFGLLMMIFGGFCGGIVVSKVGLRNGLIIGGIVQILSPLMFLILSINGHNEFVFFVTVGIQSFSCGVGSTAFVAYLSGICRGGYTATQFAVLYSFSSMSRIILSSVSGYAADHVTWASFFAVTTLLSILFILVLKEFERAQSKIVETNSEV